MSKINIYEIVTNRIIEQLEKGVVPWKKKWINGTAVNFVTQKPYRGINTMLLEAGEYATFKQITANGGKVKKGEKSHIIVFFKWLEAEDDNGEKEIRPMLRYYRVFEINSQVEGLKSKRKEISFDHDPIEEAENIIQGYMNAPDVVIKPGGACYKPFLDRVEMPPLEHFTEAEEYYSTFFHEMIHSTGHTKRLNREGITSAAASFGSQTYSKEELVAEIGAGMLCSVAGVNNDFDNSIAYIQSWLKKLQNDKRLIVQAAQQAQKAADYVLGIKFGE